MKTVSIVFPEEHLEGLEELEKKFGLSRSELIRMSILDLLEKYFGELVINRRKSLPVHLLEII
ncbi:MAG: hypothetical protein B6U68_00015 [Candidatus Aenigmarchaeota archaeon ex4484_14]|nr:MAG: hypothetical protein B6U68_00015 [Candidatus Aenigmarchaeota archaeon ex4484_14]